MDRRSVGNEPREKICTLCCMAKPLSCFSWHKQRGIYRARCKACIASLAREKISLKRDEYNEYQRTRAKLPHVREMRRSINARRDKAEQAAKARLVRESDPDGAREKARIYAIKQREDLKAVYVAKTIGLPLRLIPQELLELKKSQLEIRRVALELKRNAK